jgi:hypothetical protein
MFEKTRGLFMAGGLKTINAGSDLESMLQIFSL